MFREEGGAGTAPNTWRSSDCWSSLRSVATVRFGVWWTASRVAAFKTIPARNPAVAGSDEATSSSRKRVRAAMSSDPSCRKARRGSRWRHRQGRRPRWPSGRRPDSNRHWVIANVNGARRSGLSIGTSWYRRQGTFRQEQRTGHAPPAQLPAWHSPPARARRIASVLQDRLVSLIDLGLTLKHVHWNVVGPRPIAVHEMIDPQVEAVHARA